MPGIYVEINIQCPMEDLWAKTQTPELHQQWDLRFSDISYLPRPDESQPQRFRYATRVGFGIAIVGEGETVAAQEADGSRTSALKFWSTDTRSLIREGSGYWKYIPTTNGIRFLTWYDYTVRFGLLGRCFDAAVFRPLMGWATAWSFDRLRRWLEEGLDPELFVRLHRSAIVRKDNIAGFTRNPSGRWIARLSDGTEQPVGRLYSDRVRVIAGR